MMRGLFQVANETIEGAKTLTFDKAIEVTQSPKFIIALACVYGIPLLIYLFWGALAHAKTSDGRTLKSRVIQNENFWIGIIIFGLLGLALFILIIFPIWLLPFE